METCAWRQVSTQTSASPWTHPYKAEPYVTSCRQRCVYTASDRVSIGKAGASRGYEFQDWEIQLSAERSSHLVMSRVQPHLAHLTCQRSRPRSAYAPTHYSHCWVGVIMVSSKIGMHMYILIV